MKFSFYFTSSDFDRIAELKHPDHPLLTIAHGIASSPLWSVMPNAEINVRLSPPEITVSGLFGKVDIARLKALAWQTKHALRTLRYVSYCNLEQDCRLLSARLDEQVGRDQLKKYYFTAIPRGGLIVLGFLSYIMGLERWQLEPPKTPDAPVVVVDDCSLTGKRFAQFLHNSQSNEIVFAPLYSNPELRSAIEAREARVKTCTSAHDLNSCLYPTEEDQHAFQDVFGSSADESRYRIGLTEYICFSWNEPDFTFSNPVTKKIEGNWTILPHEICLKNGPVRIPVKKLKDIRMEFYVSGDVVIMQDQGCVMIDNLVTHDRYRLNGTAADMWNTLMECGTREAVFTKFSHEYDIDPVTLKNDISGIIDDLVSRNILTVSGG